MPGPDRRVGRLRAATARSERPAGRQLRNPVHLRPDADRVGQGGRQLPAGHQPAGLRYPGGSPHTQADDAEVGGQRGRDALQRLRNVIGRVEAPWRPASAEESFGIVRRRLFQTFVDAAQFTARDVVARGFSDLYRAQQQEFPGRVPRGRLRKTDQGRLSHPSRGVRPAVHRLVGAGEVPAHPRRAAPDGGGDSSPVGKRRSQSPHPAGQHRARRRAHSVGADPVSRRQLDADHRKGCRRRGLAAAADRCRAAEPGEVRRQSPRCAGDFPRFRSQPPEPPIGGSTTGASSWAACCPASRRPCSGMRSGGWRRPPPICTRTTPATGSPPSPRSPSWRKIEPSRCGATRTASAQEIAKRVRADLRQKGDFSRVHPLPHSGQDVPDDMDARLVVIGIEYPHSRGPERASRTQAGAGDSGVARQHAAHLPQHAGVSRRRRYPPPGAR